MATLPLVEPRDALDRHVVRLRRSGREDDVFGVSTDDVGHLLRVMAQSQRLKRRNAFALKG